MRDRLLLVAVVIITLFLVLFLVNLAPTTTPQVWGQPQPDSPLRLMLPLVLLGLALGGLAMFGYLQTRPVQLQERGRDFNVSGGGRLTLVLQPTVRMRVDPYAQLRSLLRSLWSVRVTGTAVEQVHAGLENAVQSVITRLDVGDFTAGLPLWVDLLNLLLEWREQGLPVDGKVDAAELMNLDESEIFSEELHEEILRLVREVLVQLQRIEETVGVQLVSVAVLDMEQDGQLQRRLQEESRRHKTERESLEVQKNRDAKLCAWVAELNALSAGLSTLPDDVREKAMLKFLDVETTEQDAKTRDGLVGAAQQVAGALGTFAEGYSTWQRAQTAQQTHHPTELQPAETTTSAVHGELSEPERQPKNILQRWLRR